MPYRSSLLAGVLERVEGLTATVNQALADGQVTADEADAIASQTTALNREAHAYADAKRAADWVEHTGHPPRDFVREHPEFREMAAA